METQWVDVKDRLPNDKREVLIIDANYDSGYYGIASYTKANGWSVSGPNYWLPTHWQPLPKPPFTGEVDGSFSCEDLNKLLKQPTG